MSTSNRRELQALMEAEGFRRVRCGKHWIWRHTSGVQVVTSQSPSDHRRLLSNVRNSIRRAWRQHTAHKEGR